MRKERDPLGSQSLSSDHAHSPERAWRVFARLIKSRDLRITQARRIVFDEVFSRHDHFTADQLAHDLARGRRHVSRSTVYNALSLLVESGLVSEVFTRHDRAVTKARLDKERASWFCPCRPTAWRPTGMLGARAERRVRGTLPRIGVGGLRRNASPRD